MIRIDVKSKADPRQIKNIDFAKRLKQSNFSINECMQATEKSLNQATKLKQFGVFQKTFLQVLKIINTGKNQKSAAAGL